MIGSKLESTVVAKVVVPSKVTLVPFFSFWRSMGLAAGAAMLESVMSVHDETAVAISSNLVTVQPV